MINQNTTWSELKTQMLNSQEAKKAYDDADKAWKLRELLIEAREHANLTQKELAEKMNIAQSNLCKLEKNPDRANIQSILRYIEACDANIDFKLSF